MEIIGEQVVLRNEARASDRDDLFRWCNLEEWNYFDEPDQVFVPISREQFDLLHPLSQVDNPNPQRWQVDTLEGQHLGWVNYYQLDEQSSSVYVGIDLPEADTWGKGFGTESLRLWVDYLFRQLSLQTIYLKTWTGNHAMRRVAIKCGFQEVTRSPHRAEFSVRGERLEFIEYAVSRSEWANHS
ncbi:MAG: GNAT family N-acetyltransferase [Anaerolineae bacterium]|nr:GNAT family N-acetyltransferase [Anaerolineae bacterium]